MHKVRSKATTHLRGSASIKEAFRNENGAIDLASIMVGIIVIGLIGGVIAATVFAVIPWSQDNAAKHQLESVHNAQNAQFGLSADPSRELATGLNRNSFADSTGLAMAGLLVNGDTYCTVVTADGKDYLAFSESSSGKVFVSKNSDKSAETADTELPCADGVFDEELVSETFPLPELADGTSPSEETPAPEPVYTELVSYDFTDGQYVTSGRGAFTNKFTLQSLSTATGVPLNGRYLRATTARADSEISIGYTNSTIYEPGETYRITFRAYLMANGTTDAVRAKFHRPATGWSESNVVHRDSSKGITETVTLTFEASAIPSQNAIYIEGSPRAGDFRPELAIDDFKLEKVTFPKP